MSTCEQRRSARIFEMDARVAQQVMSKNKCKQTCKAAIEDSSDEEIDVNLKRGSKKIKIRPTQNLVVETVEDRVQRVGIGEGHQHNSAVVSPRTGLSLRRKFELILDVLERRDWYNIFAEPVNPDEVADYYETIKKPMDFSTISRKVNDGSYSTLAEFEYDVFLVSGNAMQFNAASTIYYRQARAIKDLSQKLFDTLKTDPENFESQCSVLKQRAARRPNIVSSDQSTAGPAPKSSREVKGNQHNKDDQPGTVRPREKFLNENKPVVSSVYKSPESISLMLMTRMGKAGYEGSLVQFAKDLGPKPRTVTQEKVQKRKADDTFRHQIEASQLETQTRKYVIPNVASGHKGIPSALYTRSQNFGGKMDMLGDKLNVQRSVLGTPNINDTLNRGFVQAGNKLDYTGAYGGKLAQGIGDGNLSFNQSMAGQGFDTRYLSTTWNNPGSNITNLVSNSTDKGKNVLTAGMDSFSKENLLNFSRNLVPPMREVDNSLKDNLPYEDVGNKVPRLPTTWDTNNNWDNVNLSYINMAKNFQTAEVTSLHPMQNLGDLQGKTFQSMKPGSSAFKQNLPDQGIGRSYLYPPLLQAGDSYFPSAEHMLHNYDNLIQSAINMGVSVPMTVANPMSMLQSPGDKFGKSVQTMTDSGAAFKNLMPNQGTGSAYISTPLLSYFPVKTNPASNPETFIPASINSDAMNVQIPPGMTSSGPSMLDTLYGISSSATLESLLLAGTAGSDISSLIGGVNQISAVGAGCGTNYAGNFEQTGQALSRPKPTQWVAQQPIFNFPMQEQPRTATADLAGQAASSEWQAPGAYTPNVQVTADASMMNWTHSTDHHQGESNTGAPLYNNHEQTGL